MKQSLIDLVLFSDKRKDLMLLLKEKPRDIDVIKESLSVDAGTIQPHLKKMKAAGLIIEADKTYCLSTIGEVILENLQPLLDMATVFERNPEYWSSHNLNSIPYDLLKRINEIGNFELLEPDTQHLAETPKKLLENLFSSKKILTYVAYFHPQAPSIYAELAGSGAEITLCMTENVAKYLFAHYPDEAKRLYRAKNSKLFVLSKPAGIPLVIVLDSILVFKLFELDGKFRDQLVLSSGKGAILWGIELFEFCMQQAEPLDKKELIFRL